MDTPESGQIEIAADDRYSLYVNGRHVASGRGPQELDKHDISRYLVRGRNTVAVSALNVTDGPAGMVARVTVKSRRNTHVDHSTDKTWKTSTTRQPIWQMSRFSDRGWKPARSFATLGNPGAASGTEVAETSESSSNQSRFSVAKGFRVQWVVRPKDTGSLIAMAFNEFGDILASREGGPLLLVRDSDKDGVPDKVSTYCDKVKNCQGILPINGHVLVTADGPDGAGLYRLSDEGRDGNTDHIEKLISFKGPMREHGPHAIRLGPDGLIYVIVGNHTTVATKAADTSPYRNAYEGSLNEPRYEDPGGHASGVKAPGGMILRTDTDGSFVETFAGGLRNAYDIAFTRNGELLTWDSDMEWDRGAPWHRPTRLIHVQAGGEYGWRSGWAKWPAYFHDGLPAMLNTGNGSPTGIEVYNHYMYPTRYQNAAFMGDWTNGRIVVARTKENRGTLSGDAEVFVEGRPLNITDLAVGPDGWLYFITGGRGTEGGIYRVVHSGEKPKLDWGTGVRAAILQPQPRSAWGRQAIAEVKEKVGDKWDPEITAVAQQVKNRVEYRLRALELMHLYGPTPTSDLLIELSRDANAEVRAKSAYLMGIHADENTAGRLVDLLEDKSATVRRIACESIVRCGALAPVEKLTAATGDKDRSVSFAARRALEQQPAESWQQLVLTSTKQREFIVGSTALLIVDRNRETSRRVLDRASEIMQGYVSDRDFVDILRVMQLALDHGGLTPDELPVIRKQIAEEYPSSNQRINRELIRLIAYMNETSVIDRMLKELSSTKVPSSEKLHAAMHAARLEGDWTSDQKLAMLKFYEKSRKSEGGESIGQYIDVAARDFFKRLDDGERQQVLADVKQWPHASLAVLAGMPKELSGDMVVKLMKVDKVLDGANTESLKRLRMGVAAVLGRSGNETATAYLREVYENEPDRRPTIALALVAHPEGENWDILVKALPILEGGGASHVMNQLAKIDRRPEDPDAIRQLILLGARRPSGIEGPIEKLLIHWTGESIGADAKTSKAKVAAWHDWYTKTHVDAPALALPAETDKNKWTYEDLLKFAEGSGDTKGDASKGAMVFAKAQCAKCHRYGDHGETIGPDLTTVSRRFHTKEVLQSVLYPSQVIPSQYASKKVITDDGRLFVGIVAPRGDDSVMVLQASGEKIKIPKKHIDEIVPSKVSAMPDGLLNSLTPEEIADLFAYLRSSPEKDIAKRPRETRKQ